MKEKEHDDAAVKEKEHYDAAVKERSMMLRKQKCCLNKRQKVHMRISRKMM